MTGPAGEMPFLDHLEELRLRILRSLGAVVVGFGVGLWAVQQFQLVSLLKRPIAPYLLDGKLIVTSPTEPVMIVLKLGFLVGLVLASPVILWQTWAFLAPALYAREKKALVPSLFLGLLLFLTGAVLAYLYVVPQALRVLLSFQSEAIAPFITYDAYFGFVLQVVLALGISFELPLVMVILSWVGVVGPAEMSRFRRYAIVLAFIGGAILSPGADVLSMLMMTLPLIVLYEVGLAGSVIVQRRRRRAALISGLVLLGLAAGARPARGQIPRQEAQRLLQDSLRRDSLRSDTTRLRPGQALDSATAQRMGLPTAPSRSFAPADSVITELLRRRGYQATRYRADSATVFVEEERVRLEGEALTERRGALLEADTITYRQEDCLLDATGDPRLFDAGQVMVGQGIRYDTCRRRGVITDALTNFNEGSTVWFLRGNVAQDSSSSRIYAGSSEITSCDLPSPHYHFSGREVKWISRTMLVARPVTLYVRDVPILWLPFIFQDVRPGRRSGILIPQFGINDLIRPSSGYNRQVTNIGYYWAPSDYLDLTGRLDWFANRYLQYGVTGQYRWLDRFVSGTLGFNQQREFERDGAGGGSSLAVRWDHRQTFNLSTSLNLNLNYASSTRIIRQNAIDPLQNTQQITSSLNFSKRYGWGTLTLGGNRRQSLTDGSVQQLLPAITLSPVPIALGSSITWSPGLSFTNNTTSNRDSFQVVLAGGVLDTIGRKETSRTTALSFQTPVRFGSFNWSNSVQVTDAVNVGRELDSVRVDDPTTPDPTDSILVRRAFTGRFESTLDWDTGINLPVLFRGSWKLQPVIGIANVAAGQPFALRNRNTGGDWVQQGKRPRFGISSSPTLFGFFPGIGPLSRIRHSVSPVISYNYEPAADVPEEFARAIARPGQQVQLRSLARQVLSVSLSQTFEGKRRPPGADTTSANAPKLRLLSISTSAVTYDFEQAKQPGRTGWATETLSNSFLSDLLPGFNLSLTHDLWDGPVGTDAAQFDPFLQSVSASFSVSGNTLRSIGSIFGLASTKPEDRRREDFVPPSYVAESGRRRSRPGSFYSTSQAPLRATGRAFTAAFNYSLSRPRPDPDRPGQQDAQNLGFSTSFSPTPFWALSWSTQYNITDNEFESHVVRLERDLHEWRAGFNFIRNANGNFAFYFSIYLTDLPDLKFDYDQTTFEQ